MKSGIVVFLAALLMLPAVAKNERKSLLDSDPDVIYREDFATQRIDLLVVKPVAVFATKEGGRQLGTIPEGRKVEFLGMTDRAYRVRGEGVHAGVAGWVSPQSLASKDPDFIENLKKVFERQMKVRELIAAEEIAIGMSLEEVAQVLGKPTKTTVRQTANGEAGTWEYITYETITQYRTIQDPVSGQLYRQAVGTIREEKGKTVVEFANDAVVAIEESESARRKASASIIPPVILRW
jgi:hypothetical protein